MSLAKQVLEQQTVNWYFRTVFIENVMGLFLLYFYTHVVYTVGNACSFLISKTTYRGVGIVVKIDTRVINCVAFSLMAGLFMFMVEMT